MSGYGPLDSDERKYIKAQLRNTLLLFAGVVLGMIGLALFIAYLIN